MSRSSFWCVTDFCGWLSAEPRVVGRRGPQTRNNAFWEPNPERPRSPEDVVRARRAAALRAKVTYKESPKTQAPLPFPELIFALYTGWAKG